MCYKDMTFCPGPCATTDCYRHSDRINKDEDARKFLTENTWMPISWFVNIPVDCAKYVKPT